LNNIATEKLVLKNKILSIFSNTNGKVDFWKSHWKKLEGFIYAIVIGNVPEKRGGYSSDRICYL